MIRNILLMATSGVVLFSKEYVHSVAKPRLVGSLLTAMLEFSLVTVGMPVSYIELSGLGVTIVGSEAAKVGQPFPVPLLLLLFFSCVLSYTVASSLLYTVCPKNSST